MSRARLRSRFARRLNLVTLEQRLNPVNLQNVLVNNPAADVLNGQDTQSETSTIVFGNTVLASFNDSGAYTGPGFQHFTGFARSTDGGATFTDLGNLPGNDDAGDPILARDNVTGRIYLATLSFTGTNLNVFRSDDNGSTWSAAVNAHPGLSGPSFDKEWMVVDNFAGAGQGNIYVATRNFGTGGGIVFSRSTNGGASFSNAITVGTTATIQGAHVAVGPDHSVYVSWLENSSGQRIRVRRSTDQGVTFGAAVTVTSLLTTGINGDLGMEFRSNTFPQIAVNPINGHLYCVTADNPAGADRGDIFLSVSTNNGATWGARVKVNDDATTTDQFQPAISVSPDGTKLSISFYDRRLSASNTLIDYFGAIGDISLGTGAVTLQPNFRITNTSFPAVFGVDPVINGAYMGDYDTNVTDASHFHYVWADNRDASTFRAGNQANVRHAKVGLGFNGAMVISTTPSGLVNPPISSVDINYNRAMDPSSFAVADDIVSFTGPGGVDLKAQITGFSFLNSNKTLRVNFNGQALGGPYSLTVAPTINAVGGGAVDDDMDGIGGEPVDDATTVTFSLPTPQVTGHTPSGATAPPINSLQINFNQPMNPASFAVADDVVSFTGPAGNMVGQISGFTWINSNKTLQLNFNSLVIPGSYSLVLGSQVFTAGGAPLDQDADGIGGEPVEDRYTASFSTLAVGGDAFGYQFAASTYDGSTVLTPGGSTTTLTGLNSVDDSNVSFSLGANRFRFYGVEYSTIFVSSNGLITFDSGVSDYFNTDLTASPGTRTIAPFWDDQVTSVNSAIDDLVLARFRDSNGDTFIDQLVICWRNVHYYANQSTGDNGITYSAVLEVNTGARSGDMFFHYSDLSDGTAGSYNNGGSATVGIKDVGVQGGNRLLISQDNASNPLVGNSKAIRVFLNQPPTAEANGPYNVAVNGTVALSSAGTSDPNQAAGTLFYLWDLDGDGAYGESGVNATRGDENVPNPIFNSAGLPGGTAFPVALRVIDSAGSVANDSAIVNIVGGAPPQVQNLKIDDGSGQRSNVRSLTVTFDSLVNLPGNPADAFSLTSTAGTTTLSVDTSGSTPTQTIAKITFSGTGTAFGGLIDGRYAFTILAGQVSNANGNLDGNGNGTGGDDYTTPATGPGSVFRLFGDADGDADVDAADYGAFRMAFGGASAVFDSDGDNDVDAADFGQFRQRFGTSV